MNDITTPAGLRLESTADLEEEIPAQLEDDPKLAVVRGGEIRPRTRPGTRNPAGTGPGSSAPPVTSA